MARGRRSASLGQLTIKVRAMRNPGRLFLFGMGLALAVPSAAFSATESPENDQIPAIVSHMKALNSNLRRLRRQVRDPDNREASLELLVEIKKHAVAAQKEEPLKTPDLPETDREAFLKAFRDLMDEVIETIEQAEAALKDGRDDEAQGLVRKIYGFKSDGHKRFQKKEEE